MRAHLRLSLLAIQTLLIFGQNEEMKDPRNSFFNYDTVHPVVLSTSNEITKNEETKLNSDQLVLKFKAFGEEYEAHLNRSQDLLSENYFVSHQEDGYDTKVYPSKEKKIEMTQCYYQGSLLSMKNSWIAVSTCNGISGVFFDGKEVYYIEPYQESGTTSHFVFKAADAKTREWECRVNEEDSDVFNEVNENYDVLRGKYEVLKDAAQYRKQFYVEVLMVNDNGEYRKMRGDTAAIERRNIALLNSANAYYTEFNIKFVMVGAVHWSSGDLIPMTSKSLWMIGNFSNYREKYYLRDTPNDLAILFTVVKMEDGHVLGTAYPSGLCTENRGTLVMTDGTDVMGDLGNILAHELGHSLGMGHDNPEKCTCEEEYCVMYPMSGSFTKWSSCSKKVIDRLHSEGKQCLENVPSRPYNKV